MLPHPVVFDQGILIKSSPACFPSGILESDQPFGIWVCAADGGALDSETDVFPFIPGMLEALCGPRPAVDRLAPAHNPTDHPAPSGAESTGPGAATGDQGPDSDERRTAEEKWRLRLEDGKNWNHEYLVPAADGSTRYLLSRGMPVRNAEGETLAWIGINLDITDVRDEEEDLRLSQDRFRVALESGCDLLYESDLSAGGRRWFGPVDDLLGFAPYGFDRSESAWEAALHPEDGPLVLEARRRHLEAGAPFHMEYRIVRRDGEILHWLDRGKAMRDRDGTPLMWIGFVTDMTERRRGEEMLRKSEERRRMSQRLEVIGRLAGGIAHDFNNLLTAVNGYGELVLAQLDEDSDLAPHMREILRAGDRAATLTRQLLAFSRRQVLAPKVLDLNTVIRDLRKMLGEFLGPSVEVRFQPGVNQARIKADPAQVEQVILNLALNAKDAMPQGGRLLIETEDVEIRAGDLPSDPLEGEPRPGPYVVLCIQDSGVGMDEETKSHLFEPFYTTKGRAQGLGLSAVYGIIKQSGGHITVRSVHGEGTQIRLYWPRFDFERSGSGRDHPGSEFAQMGTGFGGSPPLVLVADDEDSQRTLVRNFLESHGYAVLAAGSGREALELANRTDAPIDLLLVDVIMPGMGGLELAQTLQHLAPRVKVLFMSGYIDHLHVRQGILERNREFIGKPFSRADLIAKVQAVLKVSQAA